MMNIILMEFGVLLLTVTVLLLIGLQLSKRQRERVSDKQSAYRKAVEIDSDEMFLHGIKTGVGNAFVYGTVSAEDPVTAEWTPEPCILAQVDTEQYTMHTRWVTKTRVLPQGKTETYQEMETYYTWDCIYKNILHAQKIRFRGQILPYQSISFPPPAQYKVLYQGPDVRYRYYVLNSPITGTVFTTLTRDGMKKGSRFYCNLNLKEAKSRALEGENRQMPLFWLIWAIVTVSLALPVCLLALPFVINFASAWH